MPCSSDAMKRMEGFLGEENNREGIWEPVLQQDGEQRVLRPECHKIGFGWRSRAEYQARRTKIRRSHLWPCCGREALKILSLMTEGGTCWAWRPSSKSQFTLNEHLRVATSLLALTLRALSEEHCGQRVIPGFRRASFSKQLPWNVT